MYNAAVTHTLQPPPPPLNTHTHTNTPCQKREQVQPHSVVARCSRRENVFPRASLGSEGGDVMAYDSRDGRCRGDDSNVKRRMKRRLLVYMGVRFRPAIDRSTVRRVTRSSPRSPSALQPLLVPSLPPRPASLCSDPFPRRCPSPPLLAGGCVSVSVSVREERQRRGRERERKRENERTLIFASSAPGRALALCSTCTDRERFGVRKERQETRDKRHEKRDTRRERERETSRTCFRIASLRGPPSITSIRCRRSPFSLRIGILGQR